MIRRRQAICVTTSKPSSALTPGGGGGSIIMLCPRTGSILSSFRTTGEGSSGSLMGFSTLSLFPESYGSDGDVGAPLMMGYGGTPSKRDDNYGMLLSLRAVSSPPLLHWKCRLPEPNLSSGLIISPCGYYIVAGGSSGTCYVWSLFGGALLRSFKAHYRSVTAMTWSDCGGFLVTGGADGMVHAFSLLDLVDKETPASATVAPVRSWSAHHLPVTSLARCGNSRIVSISDDGQVVLLELFSEKLVATLQMPHAIRAVAVHASRLYAGSIQGSIFSIDLDSYAMHQTAQLGVTVKRRATALQTTHANQVFSLDNDDSYKTELQGHEKPITSLAVLEEEGQSLLFSGDEAGVVRIWDLESRGCVRVVNPWSRSVGHPSTASTPNSSGKKPSTAAKLSTTHPVTGIWVVPRGDEARPQISQHEAATGMSFSSTESSKKETLASLVLPLQRFENTASADNIPVPFLRRKRHVESMTFFHSSTPDYTPSDGGDSTKRPRVSSESSPAVNGGVQEEDLMAFSPKESQSKESDEIRRLQLELQEAKSTIERWQNVNNKLMAKLERQAEET